MSGNTHDALLPINPPGWLVPLRDQNRNFFVERLGEMRDAVLRVHGDGLPQILPIVLASGRDVADLRSHLGKAVWRRIHHASEMTNFLRCLVWLRFRDQADWASIVDLPECHLRSCRNAIDWPTAKFSARLAEPGKFSQTAMLYRDTLKMGGTPRPSWSFRRLKREHEKLAVSAAIEQSCPKSWADPFEVADQGYVFTRLVSDRDLMAEGKALRHCVASFREDARSGACVVMKCTGAERATLRFDHADWELRGFANSDVSPECAAAATTARLAFLNQQ